MAEDEPQDNPGEEGAAEAFEALRAEVAQLRAGVEGLSAALKDHAAPDYAPTLGAMAKTLEEIGAHPALQLTPQGYGAEVRAGTEAIRRRLESDVQAAVTTIAHASGEVRRFAGDLRTREQQRTWLIRAGAGGLIAGAVAWALVAGPLARTLPASWRLPERMAAAALGLDRWQAGAQLMRTSDPTRWNGLAVASQLWTDNGATLEGCARSATRTGKDQRCTVTLVAPNAPNPGQAKD